MDVDLADPAVASVTYRIRQRFSYTYDGPAWQLAHRLVVIPPRQHGDQAVRAYHLAVSDPAATVTWERTADGSPAALVRLDTVPRRLDFDATVVLTRTAGAGPPTLPASALTGRRLLTPTPLTAPDAAITATARSLAAPDPLETALRCCAWVHRRIGYAGGSTDVTTTAAQALAGGRGVCQDHAHVMLALCRAAGVPARYVSGHMTGESASHAWVEVIVPADAGLPGGGARAVALDPCHDRLADQRYVTVATGRDYTEVAPTSGSYRGPGRGTLSTRQRVDVIGTDLIGTGAVTAVGADTA
ncbi:MULTISPECIES: transglutaminase family protein [unclassified Frankia]|uniref:transglutaminase family protein n=1 Tax=unclassified Frankia TaxID=2632575 RepID=UPI0020255E2E